MILKWHMPTVCLGCKRVVSFTPTLQERAHLLSHGYCRPCAEKLKRQILAKKP